ncbi:PfkB family carbohydrate kinase [Paracoccus sp. MA]|uniref:PfkB family carbohydrate kinase n=1 Tax=Paracoccus sp. MA TaxID=2895796 RepID=UPI001E4A3853|nr:PfkB family carbohydrate kinase [Paracoccus sp. MA]UFM63703.1 PfkB family carbohydrate kinase [Paracoccus sp. MA]
MTAPPRILCLGAMLWDVIGRSAVRVLPGADLPGRITRQPGGVALNVALALARQGLEPAMLSAVGRDPAGEALVAEAGRRGVDTRWLWRDTGLVTDSYLAIESPEGLVAAIADARALETAGTALLAPLRDGRLGDAARPWRGTLVVDGNPSAPVLTEIARDPCLADADLRIVPASPDKAARLRVLIDDPRAIFHLNRAEAEALAGRSLPDAARAAEAVLALGARRVLVTDGAGTAADAAQGAPTLTATPRPVAAIRVTGAGDSFLAAHLAAESRGATRAEALTRAMNAASDHVCGKDQP